MAPAYTLPTLLLALSIRLVNAAPFFGFDDSQSSSPVTTLSSDQTSSYARASMFAQIAYCTPQAVLRWPSREGVPKLDSIAAGGDGTDTPWHYIGYDPAAQSIVVAHQGTDPSNMVSIANDLLFNLDSLDKTLFPNADSSIKAHSGFADTFRRTANQIIGNVTSLLESTGAKKVEVYGHSLGAAVALMDSVHLRQNLSHDVQITSIVFGLPRTGNKAWADFVDNTIPGFVHVHNKKDPIGQLPPRAVGFQHPSGEVHIQDDGSSVSCPGQENSDPKCLSAVHLLSGVKTDHKGPYYGHEMGKSHCPL